MIQLSSVVLFSVGCLHSSDGNNDNNGEFYIDEETMNIIR